MDSNRIDETEMQNALMRSGYFLEGRIENILQEANFYVEANSAYSDSLTGKSREIDIYALAANCCGDEILDYVFAALIIECIHPPQPAVFFNKKDRIPFLSYLDAKVAGIPVKISKNNSWISVQEFLELDKFHHYCTKEIATQYCSFEKKGNNKWVATHIEKHHESINSLCTATQFYQEKHFRSWQLGKGKEATNLEFYYPILVVDGELYKVEQKGSSCELTSTKHVNFKRRIIMNGRESSFHIDVVTEDYLPMLISMIRNELKKISRKVKRNSSVISESKNEIIKRISKFKSTEEIVSELSFCE